MPVHKLIRGGEQWLPFAMSKLRQLERAGGNHARNWQMPDGAYVHVRIVGSQHFLTIIGAGPHYEFYASEHVSDIWCASPGYFSPGDVHGRRVVGSWVRMGPNGRPKPLQSNALTPGEGKDWPVSDPMDGPASDGPVRTWASWQNQKFFEHPFYPADTEALLTSVQCQASGMGGTMGFMSASMETRIGNAGLLTVDVGLDVRPALYDKTGLVHRGAPELEHAWLWWRRAATQVAGGRRFIISTDNYGRFQVYPAGVYPDGLVPAGQFKAYTPPYPAWVTVPNPADVTHQLCHWLWQFDSEGKRCAAIAFNSQAPGLFSRHYLKQGAIIPEVLATLHPDEQAGIVAAREDTPGLVEFAIDIEVTGPGAMDFDVTFTLLRQDYFPTSGRFLFDCAYTLPCVYGVAPDTLVTAEIDIRTAPGDYIAGPVPANYEGYVGDHFEHNIRSAQAWLLVCANDAAMAPTELQRWAALMPSWTRCYTYEGYLANIGYTTPPQSGWGHLKPGTMQEFLRADDTTVVVYPDAPVGWGPKAPGEGQRFAPTFGFVPALELRTLSILTLQVDGATGASTYHLVHGNTLDQTLPGASFMATTVDGTPGTPTDKVPAAAIKQYLHCLLQTMETEWGQGFSVHPAGHWAFGTIGAVGGGAFDIVQAKGKARTSHRALFNQAYGQDRPYSFYTEPFEGKRYNDQGSFRTAGLWLTF